MRTAKLNRTRCLLFIAVLAMTVAASMTAASADAFTTHLLQSRIEAPGPGRESGSLAVNQTTEHLYVVANKTLAGPVSTVYNLTPAGALDPTTPELALTSRLGFSVAVDNSGTATAGDIWVAEQHFAAFGQAGFVQQFNPAGLATSVQIAASSLPANGTPQAGGLPPVANTGSFSPKSAAVGPNGDLFVIDYTYAFEEAGAARAIDVFEPSGGFVAQLANGKIGQGVSGLAVATNENIYLSSSGPGVAPEELGTGLFELDSSGGCVPVGCTALDSTPAGAVTVDRATGHVLVTQPTSEAPLGAHEPRFAEFEAAGSFLGEAGEGELNSVESIVIDESSGDVIVGDPRQGSGQTGTIDVFGPSIVLPDAETEGATSVSDRTATLNGEIGAAGVAGATCTFQYVDDQTFTEDKFRAAAEVPCNPAGPFSGTGLQKVDAAVEGLRGGTLYHVRLLGKNASGVHGGEARTFTTFGPTVSAESVSGITETEATLEAQVDPRGGQTIYSFEYVSQAQFEEGGYQDAIKVPNPAASLGIGSGAVRVSQRVGSLVPGSTYRFRVLATSVDGPVPGETATASVNFATYLPSTALPDGRAYEQVSPVDKNGADIQAEPNAVEASTNGDAVTFFANSGIPGGVGAQQFPSYLATRGEAEAGWTTQGLLPASSTGPFGKVLGWSQDLSEAFVSNKLVGSSEAIYGRRSEEGSLYRIGSGGEGERFGYALAALSDGQSQVLFENKDAQLVPEAAPGVSNVYIWDKATGTLRLASALNDGQAPAAGAFAGPYAWFRSSESTGGARAEYYTEAEHALSNDGRFAFFTEAETGKLYVRENPTRPQSPVDGEGNCTDPDLACTTLVSAAQDGLPESSESAAFLGASADGRYTYFLSAAKLTTDATVGAPNASGELYRYDTQSHLLEDVAPDPSTPTGNGAEVRGVLGISADGGTVYFAANAVLASGASQGDCTGVEAASTGTCNIYSWHDGAIEFVSAVSAASDYFDWSPTSFYGGGATISAAARITADGDSLLFTASSKEDGGAPELYLYHREGGPARCVSCALGVPPAGGASLEGHPELFTGPKLEHAFLPRNLSAGGERVFFQTAAKLVAGDTNGVTDVYEWEADGVGTCTSISRAGGCIFLISSGTDPRPSYLADADEAGNNIFFVTASKLVAQDQDELVDLYDARVGGGIASQNRSPSAPCLEEVACRGQATGTETGQTPASGTFVGPGNPTKQPRCRKGTVRRGTRCVKEKHKKSKAKAHGKHSKRHAKKAHSRGKKGGPDR